MTDSLRLSQTHRSGSWSSCIDAHLASTLKACNVKFEPIDPAAVRLCAVPLSADFNKMCTNLLVHRGGEQVRAYVDIDLAYNGPRHAVRAALNGPCNRNWRQLSVNIPVGTVGQVIRDTLEVLGSSVMDLLKPSWTMRISLLSPTDNSTRIPSWPPRLAPSKRASWRRYSRRAFTNCSHNGLPWR